MDALEKNGNDCCFLFGQGDAVKTRIASGGFMNQESVWYTCTSIVFLAGETRSWRAEGGHSTAL